MQREEFIEFTKQPGANIRELCRRYGLSSATAYKWMERYEQEGVHGLGDRSRKPHHSPARTTAAMEKRVLELHERFPFWGGRKLRALLAQENAEAVPAASTVNAILRRHGCRVHYDSNVQPPFRRFEHERPNDLWQMDFKGDFPLSHGRCYPLTLLDDHSRYALCLQACGSVSRQWVQPTLEKVFARYGLPRRILCDNGSPWGGTGGFTTLGVWLLRLGVDITHGRPFHPQTQGKCERFHRSLKVELLNRSTLYPTHDHCQKDFDHWRHTYNTRRPHQALAMATPSTRYHPSSRSLPSRLPSIEYLPQDTIRTVKSKGEITFKNFSFTIGRAFCSLPVALRPTSTHGFFEVFFSWKHLGSINLCLPLKPKFLYNPLIPPSSL